MSETICKIELFLNCRLPVQLFRGERRSLAEVLGRAGHQGQVASIRPATRPPGSAGGVTEEGENSSVVGCNCSQGFGQGFGYSIFSNCGSGFRIRIPDPWFDDLKLKKIYSWKFNFYFLYQKLQFTYPYSALKKKHPALQNMKILYFFLFLWVIFALLDPDPNPATQINADPHPKPWLKLESSLR